MTTSIFLETPTVLVTRPPYHHNHYHYHHYHHYHYHHCNLISGRIKSILVVQENYKSVFAPTDPVGRTKTVFVTEEKSKFVFGPTDSTWFWRCEGLNLSVVRLTLFWTLSEGLSLSSKQRLEFSDCRKEPGRYHSSFVQ